jgi:Putative MetA-pathway of phenol degradation
MRMRFSFLFFGAPAADLLEMRKQPARKTIMGASINVIAPTGQFFSDKLINLGANRWSFRPELALSQSLGKKFMFDLYTGVWLFTNNDSFYPGKSVRSQEPMGTFQGHLSYNFNPTTWVAFNATYYIGGTSTIDQITKDDRQANIRLGLTAVVPTGKTSSLKFSASTGAVVRIGQDFSTYSIGWQKSWIPGLKPKK